MNNNILINEKKLLDKLRVLCNEEEKFSMALIDFDNWKSKINNLNDLISDFTRVLDHSKINRYYYFGNDEFIIFFNQNLDGTFRDLFELKILWENKREHDVTFSVGLVSFPIHGRTPEDLFRGAEEGIYRAKHEGRDKICQPENEKLILKSNYYYPYQLERLKEFSEKTNQKESIILRLALDEFFRRHDTN